MKFLKLISAAIALVLSTSVNAATCNVNDVTIGGVSATSCGLGTTNNDFTPVVPPGTWQVNTDSAGGRTDWSFYESLEGAVDEFGNPIANVSDGNTTSINLTGTSLIGDGSTTGTFTLNVSDPTLITLKAGSDNYLWYYFSPIAQGENVSGEWNLPSDSTAALSTISAYTTVVPVPAAVWLFGSGLIGLIGFARRKK